MLRRREGRVSKAALVLMLLIVLIAPSVAVGTHGGYSGVWFRLGAVHCGASVSPYGTFDVCLWDRTCTATLLGMSFTPRDCRITWNILYD